MHAMNRRRGRPPHPDILTPSEWEVVHMVRHGMPNRLIASRRGTSLDATKFHIANVLDKLGLESRAELRKWPGVPADSALNHTGRSSLPLELGTIGQVSWNVTDVPRAEAFFRDTLKLPHLFTFGDLAFFDCGGLRLFVSNGEGGPKDNSVLYFRVPDIQAAYTELIARGVTFDHAPHMIHRDTVEETWMAFFFDPEGHMLALMSEVPLAPS